MKLISKLALALLMTVPAMALPEVATMEEAVATARAENRCIFVDFTGTDWCTACIYLRTRIVESPEFEAAMGKRFVLVPVDFPRNPELVAKITPEERRRREALLTSYKIEGLPGVVLMDSDGLPFEVIHGTRRTTAEYLALVQAGLDKLAARDAALAEAEGKTGLERARALDAALRAIPEVCRDKYTSIIDEINSLDTENTLGYRGMKDVSLTRINQMEAFAALCETMRNDSSPEALAGNVKTLKEFIAQPDLVPEVKQLALRALGDTYAFMRLLPEMIRCYQEAYDIAPDTRVGRTIKRNLDYYENMRRNGEINF